MVATLVRIGHRSEGHFGAGWSRMTPIQALRRGAVPPCRARADEPGRAAARRPPRAPGDPADGGAGAVRHLDGAAAAGRPRARAVGRAAVRPDPAHPDVVRRDEHRRLVRRAAAVDPAAPVARARHGAQRRRHRGRDRRDARGRAGHRGPRLADRRDAAGHRRQRGRRRDVHRQPARPGPARRADDRPGPAHRPVDPPGAHLARGHRRRARVRPRRHRRGRAPCSTPCSSGRSCSSSCRCSPCGSSARPPAGAQPEPAVTEPAAG